MLNMILAMNKDGLIGINNELPWHLPQDLKRFKQLTNNKTVIMGKNTYLSLVPYFVDKEILPNRKKIILTNSAMTTSYENITIVNSIQEIDNLIKNKDEEFWLIGGTSLFQQLFHKIDNIYLTLVDMDTITLKEQYLRKHNTLFNQAHKSHNVNVYHFLNLNLDQFHCVESQSIDKCTFITYERIS